MTFNMTDEGSSIHQVTLYDFSKMAMLLAQNPRQALLRNLTGITNVFIILGVPSNQLILYYFVQITSELVKSFGYIIFRFSATLLSTTTSRWIINFLLNFSGVRRACGFM